MKKLILSTIITLICFSVMAQITMPVNGVAEPRQACYAFTNAIIIKDHRNKMSNATLVIRQGKIVAVGTNVSIPQDAVIVDCKGKYIYPSFIDIYSDYGMPSVQRAQGGADFFGVMQINTNIKGVYGWNQAIRTDVNAAAIFNADAAKAKSLRDIGFGTVLTHQKDGIARGTGTLVTLSSEKENKGMIKEKASAHYSFNKGSSTQSYPNSMMGTIALLRQTYLDAQWYKSKPSAEGVNLSLKYFNEQQNLPQIFEAGDKWNDLRADRIGDEFGVQYIIKAGNNEYQRINEVAATKASYIVSLNFPQAQDVEDANDARFVSLADLKHWELAPGNPAAFEKAGIRFCLTSADLKDSKQFFSSLRKAMEYGLSDSTAMKALTEIPAQLLGVYDQVGSLDEGKLANFIITNGPVFSEKTSILDNWIQGERYEVNKDAWSEIKGNYILTVNSAAGKTNYHLQVKNSTSASVLSKDTLNAKFNYENKLIRLSFAPSRHVRSNIRLSGVDNGNSWQGTGEDSAGNKITWIATFDKALDEKSDSAKTKTNNRVGKLTYPLGAYGWEEMPKQQNLLIKNATVWTGEKEGRLENTDVLVKNGKISQIGKSITDASATVIDGTGKYLTSGIIDEHSHIATASINEASQSITAEVRIGDNLNPDDINIYRQLAGGVTSSHILHGSANTIGGQTQLIKLRWGANDDELKFKGADPFIKFALGENVKRTAALFGNNRFPDTRMGVEQVMMDGFTRASDYQKELKAAEENNKKKGATPIVVRRDLELEALLEIMNKKRFITCHSYVQSEITAAMRVAEKFGFRVNIFTHVLEGYKVADKMKQHGANASTFSDWWAYKLEVQDAIPYNAGIMNAVGLNVCINSDDPEMARRLNQEAAKSVKYAGMSEDDAWKMVTLNPAKALHVDDKVGSIKAGKDADLVLWSDNPLSIYAKPEKTIVDGIVYFDLARDEQLKQQIRSERSRLIQKMIADKRGGASVIAAQPSYKEVMNCGDHEHRHGMLDIDNDDNTNR